MKLRYLVVRGQNWEALGIILDRALPPDKFTGYAIGAYEADVRIRLGWCDFVIFADVAPAEAVPLVRYVLTTSDRPVIIITDEIAAFSPAIFQKTGKHPFITGASNKDLADRITDSVTINLPNKPLPFLVAIKGELHPRGLTLLNVDPNAIKWLRIASREGRKFSWLGMVLTVLGDATADYSGHDIRVLFCDLLGRQARVSTVIEPLDD